MKAAKQSWLKSHAETLTQNLVGILIGFIILTSFGLTPSQTVHLQVVIFITSYIRSYLIRRLFNYIG